MKECPLIDKCEAQVNKSAVNSLCRAFFLRKTNYTDCPTYKLVKGTYPKPVKELLKKPRDWKKEKEES